MPKNIVILSWGRFLEVFSGIEGAREGVFPNE